MKPYGASHPNMNEDRKLGNTWLYMSAPKCPNPHVIVSEHLPFQRPRNSVPLLFLFKILNPNKFSILLATIDRIVRFDHNYNNDKENHETKNNS